ncbi:MAG: hypothetical protein U5K79_23220 [Cyclobacteriaceae bacterium]|nr:hypothetical protein [Cyclobacteriaceae bacterium]
MNQPTIPSASLRLRSLPEGSARLPLAILIKSRQSISQATGDYQAGVDTTDGDGH